ncbi:hypothetical protein [Streptomyces anulatus]|uniref:hypothetical protein n=1 Tax=Streptomyces anulatus TaxID=1892 RepID=UPI0033FDA645|nr:hypothetical protein OG238_31415 [Streptomyces anulatus]
MTPFPLSSSTATEAERLRSLRLETCSAVLHRRDNAVRVARYALARAGRDPADRLAQVANHCDGWEVAIAPWDTMEMTDPVTRPQFARLLHAMRAGTLHGVMAPSRNDISTFAGIYEDTLHTIRAVGGFLGLVRDETEL